MVYIKRKRVTTKKGTFNKRYKRAKRRGTTGYAGVLRANLNNRVARIERTIETKEGLRLFTGGTNLAVPHNNLIVLTSTLLQTTNGSGDPMDAIGQRIGDAISLKGVAIKLFLQNQAQRPKVFYRVMVVKTAKGDVPDRAKLFKQIAANKMIDQVNTERYTILAQRVCNITSTGSQAWTTQTGVLGGVPLSQNGSDVIGAIGTKIVSMWIPGSKFARNGQIIYENSGTQPKFYDYHLVVLCYDWFYTPQDVNNVGAVNEGWVKLYYKDA